MLDTSAHAVDDAWFASVDQCWCGGHSQTPSPHAASYLVCERCGTHFSARRLRPECMGQFYSYEGYWQKRQQGKQHPTLWDRQQLLEADGRVQHWIQAMERHLDGARGTAVEIGCAEGTLLLHLRQLGWQTVGVEPDTQTAAAVHERTSLDVRAGVFPDVAVPACELFVACDVLEHIPEPLKFLRAAREALRPGGVLFLQLPLLERDVPDFGAMNDKVFDPQEHVFIYSRDSIATLLETAGFEILENQDAWRRAHEIVVARRAERPVRTVRHLANLGEMFSREWWQFVDELNAFGAPHGLRQFTNWSKIWEYPWLWHHGLSQLDWWGRRVIDLGSEQSPFPWWLASKGAHVTLVETRRDWIPQWEAVRAALGVKVDWQIVDSCRLPLGDRCADVVTSLSVIEHQDDKPLAFREVARVLKSGGLFALSFDVCEPAMGMTFPEWNGRALTMQEFEKLIAERPEFSLPAGFAWNVEDIPAFLRWHRQTAAHHNYVTGAAVLRKRPAGLFQRLRGLLR